MLFGLTPLAFLAIRAFRTGASLFPIYATALFAAFSGFFLMELIQVRLDLPVACLCCLVFVLYADASDSICGAERRRCRVANRVLVQSKAAPTRRIRGYVPLPPDFATVSLHTKSRVQPGDRRRADHAFGHEANHDTQRQTGGAAAGVRCGMADSVSGALRRAGTTIFEISQHLRNLVMGTGRRTSVTSRGRDSHALRTSERFSRRTAKL